MFLTIGGQPAMLVMWRVLRLVIEVFLADRKKNKERRSQCKWWVSGKTANGHVQHYLLNPKCP